MVSTQKKPTTTKPLTTVMEDYLEAIFDLSQEKKVVRVKDIAKRMDVKMPTVSSMLRTLNERKLVDYEKYEYIDLTKEGVTIGKEMRRRHEVMLAFLTRILQVNPEEADAEACKMEHALSSATLDSFIDFMEFIQVCPRTGKSWLQRFIEFRQEGIQPDKCRTQGKSFSSSFLKSVEGINSK